VKSRRSKLLILLPFACTFVAILAASATATQATPVGTLRAEVRDLQSKDLTSYYALLSPRFHRTCTFQAFLPTGRQEEQQLRGATLRVLADRVSGSKAYLTYEFLRGGVVLGKATGDLYVEVGSKWFDELDKYTTC
jgi:hypothetical protein